AIAATSATAARGPRRPCFDALRSGRSRRRGRGSSPALARRIVVLVPPERAGFFCEHQEGRRLGERLVLAQQLPLELSESLLLSGPLSTTAEGRKRLRSPRIHGGPVKTLSTEVGAEFRFLEPGRLAEHAQPLLSGPVLRPARWPRSPLLVVVLRHEGNASRFLQPPRERRRRHPARLRQRHR